MRLNHLGLFFVSVLSILLPTQRVQADETAAPKGLAQSDWSSIRAAYEAGRHAAYADDAQPGHFVARNPVQQWRTRYDGRGFLTTPNAGNWSWGLDLISYGRGDQQQPITGTACIEAKGSRVEYEWDRTLTEWYINDQRGFEHGYTLNHRPEGQNVPAGMLHFTLSVRGDLHPRVSENGRDVAFTSAADGSTTLTYNNLKVFDADGVYLAASFQATTAATGTHALLLTIDDSNARYPLTIDPTAQQAYLKASNTVTTDPNDWFATAVAISGDTIVIGANQEDSGSTGINGNQADNGAPESGAVYVFVRTGTTWTQQAYLKASNTASGDQFGYAVAISGDTIVVGAWQEDSIATGINGLQSDNSANEAGAAYVFVRSGTTWTQQAYLKASNTNAGDFFGFSVSVAADTIVVGAYGEASNATGVNGLQSNNSAIQSGAAYVFFRTGTTWAQQAYLKASNTEIVDQFGYSVAVSGNTIVVGAWAEDSNATGVNGNQADNTAFNSGAAYVFFRTGTTWAQQAYLKASNTSGGDQFGTTVAISGDTIVVGANQEDSNATGVNGNGADNSLGAAGAAYVFFRTGTTWAQQAYLKASNTGGNDQFGWAVAISGDTIVIGANWEDSNATSVNGIQTSNTATDAGAAYIFTRSGTTWTQQAYLKASNTDAGDNFAYAVAISGDTVLVGARLEASSTTGINGNQADNTAFNSGAAYVYVRPTGGTTWTQQAYLKASTPGGGDRFGRSVSISGDTVVVGAPQEDSNATGVNGNQTDNGATDAGAAYVFVRSAGVWSQQAYLKASNTGGADAFGIAVAISGDTIVVGASQEDSAAPGVNGDGSNNFSTNSGAAYVFVRSAGVWSQQAYLKASNPEAIDNFGSAVAVSGDTVAVAAPGEASIATGINGNQGDNTAPSAGAVYVFVRPPAGTTWSQQAYVKASNSGASDTFGFAVALAGDTLVVGAYGEDGNATGINGNQADESLSSAGAAYIFVRSGTVWSQQAYLKASNTGANDFFGASVAISGNTVAVGASGEGSNATGVNGNQADNSAPSAGAAYVFIRPTGGTTWTQQAYIKASNTGSGDGFGNAVSLSGDTLAVGAPNEASNATGVNGNQNDNSIVNTGAAYIFARTGTSWAQQAYLKPSNPGTNDFFASRLSLSGDTVVMGAAGEDSNASVINGNGADNSATDAGAAYIFVLSLPTPTGPLASPANICGGDPSALSVASPGSGIAIDWFTGSCGGTLIGTGNPFNVTPAATTTYFARARRTSDGNTSDACASVVVTVNQCRCSLADIAGGGPDGRSPDNIVDGSDFVTFINSFSVGDPNIDTLADVAGGGADGLSPDGIVDGNDFVAFINAFAAGC